MAAVNPIVIEALSGLRDHVVAERELILSCAAGRDPAALRPGLREDYEHLQSLIRQADRALAHLRAANEP